MLALLAVAKSRELAEAGKVREAADLLLDVVQFGADGGRNGVLISNMLGMAVAGMALDELEALVRSGRLSKDDAAGVAAQLAILDAGFPSSELALRNEAVLMRVAFLEQEISLMGGGGYPGLMHPRYFFVPSLMRTDAASRAEGLLHRMADAAIKPWSEVRTAHAALAKEAVEGPNPLVRIAVPGLEGAERTHRERQAQLRLIRMAALARSGAAVTELDDPFGAKLRQSKDGAKRKFWSAGRDGADNGGAGGWKPTDKDATDIVVEFEEK